MGWYVRSGLERWRNDLADSHSNLKVSQLRIFTAEVTKVAIAVGTEGRLGGQAVVPDALGEWKDLLDNVNLMAGNLTTQVRGIATVTRAIARGDLSQKSVADNALAHNARVSIS